jgi:predicted MPP superfamily phosphohydrolase
MIRIIHISDFHLESENPTFEKKEIIKGLSKDLKNYVTENTILVFTGDLIDKGGFNFLDKSNLFVNFEKIFIEELFKENPQLKGRIFIVPGNHDIERSKIDKVTEKGLQTLLIDSSELTNFIESNNKNSIHLSRLSEYKKWENEFYKKYNSTENSDFENSFIVELNNLKIGISCLNSSWLCKDDNDRGNLLIGKKQVINSLDKISHCDLKFALMHHPIEFLKEFDKEEMKLLLFKKYDVLFTGHVHELFSTYTYDLAGNIFISIANSTIADNSLNKKNVNGYSIVDYYPNDKIIAHYRKYVEQHSVFVPNTDIGTEDGKKEFPLLKDENLKIYEKNNQIITSLETRIFDKLNDHIIVSSNYTDVNCSIDNLFIEPTILNNPQNTLDEKDTKSYTIESIIADSTNYLLFGLKESGKTILLDKIFIECVRKYNQYNKIPVLLSFVHLDKDLIKVIREFLGVSSQEIDSFLKDNKIILLIDELKFSEKYISRIQNLCNLIELYPNIQLVCTTTQTFENVIPEDYLNFNANFKFNICFIQQLNSKEIKLLVSKWFNGRDDEMQENMQKLIKSFADFGLPKNPLSVTLFLWIFEKQEKKPINNSVLVELFVENLLEKTKIENIYSETFDFKNKQRLLSFIAKNMEDKGNEDNSYSIDYTELLSFVKEYISKRATIQPQKVLEDFINRGLLFLDDDNSVRFKSAFFFHYFLALHFDNDKSFKEYVFQEENYLKYIEEINYYTGLKRDDEDILKFTQEKLNSAFQSYNNDIIQNADRIDTVLESNSKKDTISFQVDNNKIKNKISEKQLEEMYDDKLSNTPIQSVVPNKNIQNITTRKNVDTVLKLASVVLKNSEDVDDFELKKQAYSNILTSSISFLMMYRDSLLIYFNENKKQPDSFPKNINFSLFIKFLPMIHQIVIYEWLGSPKLKPVILDKIEKDKLTLNISELEKFMSVFIYSDIKGTEYPEIIEDFTKKGKYKYLKDISFFKIHSYYNLRNNTVELDKKWLNLMANIKNELGQLYKQNKSEFIKKIENDKRKK